MFNNAAVLSLKHKLIIENIIKPWHFHEKDRQPGLHQAVRSHSYISRKSRTPYSGIFCSFSKADYWRAKSNAFRFSSIKAGLISLSMAFLISSSVRPSWPVRMAAPSRTMFRTLGLPRLSIAS